MTHRQTRVRISGVALTLLLVALLSQPAAQAKDTWTSVRTTNFFLVGNASEKDIRQVANRLEQFRKVFTALLPKVNFASPVPTTVIVFKSDSAYKPFKPNRNVAGYFQSGEDVNYITLTSEQTSDENPFGVIFHEYVHLLVANTMGHSVPLWFNEGIAEYYSTFKMTEENRKAVLGDVIGNHLLYLRDNNVLPLRTLLAVDYRSPYYNEGNKMNIFYAESWVLMHYLLQGDGGKRLPQLGRFLDLVASNVSVEEAFKQAFQTTFEEFEKNFRSYIQGARYMATAFTFKQKLEFDSQMQSAPITEAEAQAYLGDLLLHINHLSDAETRLQQALTLTPDLPMAQASLGMVRVRQGKFDDAQKYLQKAVAGNPQNYLAHYYYAFALSRVGINESQLVSNYSPETAATMRAELKKAIELKPDYSLLGFVDLVRGEDVDESIALLKHAMSLSRGNQRVLFMLAQLYMRKQEFAGARQLLSPMAQSNPDPQMRQQAQSLLDNIARIENQIAAFKANGMEPRLVSGGGATGQSSPADMNTMLAEALRKPAAGEVRTQGVLAAIECNAKGMTFQVRTGERIIKLHANGFDGILFVTFTPEAGGEITCGPRKPESAVVITYTPAKEKGKVDGEVIAVEFVPKDFVLKQ